MKRLLFRGRFIFIPLGIAAFLSLTSFVVMQLWNNLLPVLFHISTITFWQAMGIFILCKLLFGFGKGGGRGWGGRGAWMRHRMEDRFRNMTPEEKEKFKQKWKERGCGPWGRMEHHDRSHSFDWDEPAKEQ